MVRITTIACLMFLATALPGIAQEKGKDWSAHLGNIPFIIGYEAGMAEVKFTGKPAMLFFTATW